MKLLDFLFNNNKIKNSECAKIHATDTNKNEQSKFNKDSMKSDIDDEEDKVLNSLRKKYLDKIISDNKIVNIGEMQFNNQNIIFYDCMCCKCKRVKRISNLKSITICNCKSRRYDDWKIIGKIDKYNSFEQFLSAEKFEYMERYYVIDANKKITSENIFKGTYEDYLKVRKNTEVLIENDKYLCANCGKINDKKNNNCILCGAMKYRKGDIRKILSDRKYEKEFIDDLWDTKIIPSRISIEDPINGDTFTKDFTGGVSGFPNYTCYFLKNDKLAGMGLHRIKEVNTNFFIGDYIYYIYDDQYIEYKNVYNNYKYETNPIMYYSFNNKKIDPKCNILKNNEMQELNYMYFEKDGDSLNFYRYKNKELIRKICNIKKFQKKSQEGYLLEFSEGVKKFYSILKDELYESEDQNINNKKIYNFKDYNTNVSVDDRIEQELANENGLYSYLSQISKTNNIIYKKIFVIRNEKIQNKILFEFLKNNCDLKKIPNEFDEDNNEIYMAEIKRNETEKVSFLEYLSEIKKADDLKFKVYGINIGDIISTIFSNYDLKNKICDLIKKDIIQIENKELKSNYINKIYNHYFSTDSICIKICEKLKEKYNVDELGLLLLLLYKYGEENIFDIPNLEYVVYKHEYYSTVSVNYLCDNEENREKYNNYIMSIDKSDVKWKSELELFKLIKSYFSDAIFQYRDKFLGTQSLDVYIPSLKIAFEYQGIQHYEPIEHFGGKDKFLNQKNNDIKKKELCSKNNIDLIEWKYDEKINKIILDEKLVQYKDKVNNIYVFSEIE